ncbi:MAG: rhamnulokinase, partial [Clostridia bacterium]|nr:rhamnulokinase [Clostridia bacterium]
GIEFMSFNTVYQLYADKIAGRFEGVTDFLMLPEYFMYKLTGVKKKEFTEATTTGLVNGETLEIDEELWCALGYPKNLIKPLSQPGTLVGRLTESVKAEVGGDLDVVLCATHDTGSAVEAIEMEENAPYISSGTWSLLGVKTERAITDENSRISGYSNEGGVGYNRYQKTITGMWIIQSLRKELCPETSFGDIADMAAASSYTEIFDVNDESFMAPKTMKGAIADYFTERGITPPSSDADFFNAAYVSLADGYRKAIVNLERNTGKSYPAIYIVGGGAKNTYLNGLTEKATGKKVIALPIEATAIGNLKAQMNRK